MGYYINHELTVFPEAATPEVEYLLHELTECPGFSARTKSWDYENVVQVSARLPNVAIIIDGAGENSGDIWRKAWFSGECIIDWAADLHKPEVPSSVMDAVRYTEEDSKKFYATSALSKLTIQEREALGLE